MRALGDLRYERAVMALTDQFRFYVRGVAGRSAISALAAIGHPSTIPLFDAQTTSGYPAHRRAAYEGLARSGGAAAAAPRIEAAMVSEKEHAGTRRDGFRTCIGGSRWRQPCAGRSNRRR